MKTPRKGKSASKTTTATRRPPVKAVAKPPRASKPEPKSERKRTSMERSQKPSQPAMDPWVVDMRSALLRRRGEMARVVNSNRDQLAESQKNFADIGDRASEGVEDEIAAGLLSIESDQLDQIDAALHRIDAGTYGSCIDCGKPIPRKRLEILPFAKRCLVCEGQKERFARPSDGGEDEESDFD